MKKRVMGKKLSRDSSSRRALLRLLVKALVKHGKIETTFAKAKFAQRFIEKLAAAAREDNLAVRRRILSQLANDRKTTEIIFKNITKSQRKSGFTKITRLPNRRGDSAEMARLELIEWTVEEPKEEVEKTKKSGVKNEKAKGKLKGKKEKEEKKTK